MKKILIIGYGGTIMMVIDKKRNAVVPAENIEEVLALLPSLNEVADVSLDILENLDSTNVTPENWTALTHYIEKRMDEFDGFVVTHGTNTLAYTASALALALGSGLKKPVIITGSQLPLTVYGNDARFNFENAVKTAVSAAENNISEVMVVFDDLILRGARTLKISESRFRAFDSPAFPNIGDILSTGIHFNQYALKKSIEPLHARPKFHSNVLTIDLVPGQQPDIIAAMLASGECTGLLLKSHGAGSVPTIGSYSFLPLIRQAVNEYHIPVLITTKFIGGNAFKKTNDAPAIEALEAGALSCHDMTDVMSQVKLMWLLAQNINIESGLNTSFVGEVSV